jgi:predicted nucleic acid-binding protein
VVVDALVEGSAKGSRARAALRSQGLAAPHLLDIEVVGSLRRLVRLGELPARDAKDAIAALARLRVDRHDHTPLLGRVWELRDNVTPYDASYVALAEALGVTLLTADARLANAPGIRCEVELLT